MLDPVHSVSVTCCLNVQRMYHPHSIAGASQSVIIVQLPLKLKEALLGKIRKKVKVLNWVFINICTDRDIEYS